jgi:hypothetical protein
MGLLTGHNTLRRHLHLLRLTDSPLCRKCGSDDETSAHVLCWCEALALLRHVHLGSFFLEPENIWTFSKSGRAPMRDNQGTKGPFTSGLGASGLHKAPNPYICQSINHSTLRSMLLSEWQWLPLNYTHL